jgi:hypothetical protein
MPEDDEVGIADRAVDASRIERDTDQENQMFAAGRRAAPRINPRSPDPVGQAIKQSQTEFIGRNVAQENRMFSGNGFATARPTPSPDDLIDGAIMAKRKQIQSEMERKRHDMALRSSDRMGRASLEKDSLEYGALQHADASLQRDLYQRAHLKAADAAHQATIQEQHLIAQHVAGYFTDKAKIQELLPAGSPEERKALAGLIVKYPLIAKSSETLKDYREHVESHDTMAAAREKAAAELGIPVDQLDATSVTVGGTPGQNRATFRPRNDYSRDPLAKELRAQTGLTPEQFAGIDMSTAQRGKKDATGNFTNAYSDAAKGDQIRIETSSGPIVLKHADFMTYARAFAPDIAKQQSGETKKKTWKYNAATGQIE